MPWITVVLPALPILSRERAAAAPVLIFAFKVAMPFSCLSAALSAFLPRSRAAFVALTSCAT
jgi:hypothetical protein